MNFPSFTELKKNNRKDMSQLHTHKLAVLGDCATQHLSTALRGYGYIAGLNLDIYDADYNQIRAQIFDSHSELYEFSPQSVLIFMCSEKLYEVFCETDLGLRSEFALQTYKKISAFWDALTKKTNANILQFAFASKDDMVFGSYGQSVVTSFAYQLKELNYLLMKGCSEHKNVFLIDINNVLCELGRSVFCDEKLYYIAKMPISTAALGAVAKQVTDCISAICGRIKKCVILDLDNTLWGGVIGDDGMSGIEIGDLGSGHAFSDLQMWLKEIKKRGILLAVCSKNNENTAKQPFIEHPDMILKLDDISIFVANWNDKASNIKYIQKVLNIGFDSMVFIDDNPFERGIVREMLPQVTVPELPSDPAQYLTFLKGLNLFETASFSNEDQMRTGQYQTQVKRAQLEMQYESYDEYLKNLEMEAVAAEFDEFHYPRIAQLTQRSNQFNLRTVRYTEDQIKAVAQDDTKITLYFTLKDRFGDHGLISVVILDRLDESLFVSEWLMSCRVLKRGMEEFIINKIIETAKENGYKTVQGQYIKTPKNSMVENIYGELGFKSLGDGFFEADIIDFVHRKTFIKEIEKNDQE